MKCVVFLPGIMGSELHLRSTGEKVWPPSIYEATVGGYGRLNKLMKLEMDAPSPILTVAGFYTVYSTILDDIHKCGYTRAGANGRKSIIFPYDWRLSNIHTADLLAEHLDQEDSFEELILIGHSMGGIVLRLLVESGKYDDRPWFAAISKLITFGTPHKGAAEALIQVAKGEKKLGVSATDIRTLTNDSRYPSAYQLVPRPGTALTTEAAGPDDLPEAIDSFDPAIISTYSLNSQNIDEALAQWDLLDIKRKPENIEYFSIVGAALSTKYRNDWDGVQLHTYEGKDSGDGTVPISSAIDASVPHIFSRKKHAAIFEDRDSRFALYRILDAPPNIRPMSADTTVEARDPNALGLSVNQDAYEMQDTVEVIVSFVEPQTDPSVILQISKLNEESETGEVVENVGDPIRIEFAGTRIDSFTFSIDIDLEPGIYEIRTGSITDDPQRTMFIVSK